MSTFYGTEVCVVDPKGRINVPSRMRRGLTPEANDTFVMVRGFDGCVNLYPLDEWRKYEDRLRTLALGDEDGRAFVRVLLETAHESSVDAQGRVSLTSTLMAIAGVEKEAKLVGAFDHIEMWNPKKFDAGVKVNAPKFEEMARKLFK
jgi:MraZ protein